MSPCNQKDLPKRRDKSIQKRVCRYCNLVFNGGRALGGHIKIHLRKKKKTDFFPKKSCSKKPTTLKRNNKTSNRQSKQLVGGSGSAPPGPSCSRSRSRKVVDLTKYLSGLQWGVCGRGNEIFDLTKYFRGRGWGLKKLRGSNEGNKPAEIPLVRGNAHRIKRTRGVYMCTICNMNLLTFSAVLSHIRRPNESPSESDTTVDMPLLIGEQAREERELQIAAQGSGVVEDTQDVIEQLSNFIDHDQATIDEGGVGGKGLEVQSSTKASMVEKNYEIAQVLDSMEVHNKEPEDQVAMEDEIPKGDEMVVGGNNASTIEDNVNQEISTSKPHKMLDFDLNDFPPMDD